MPRLLLAGSVIVEQLRPGELTAYSQISPCLAQLQIRSRIRLRDCKRPGSTPKLTGFERPGRMPRMGLALQAVQRAATRLAAPR